MANQNEIITRVVKDLSTDKYGKFSAQPLQKGFGITLGNALRRVLLTSIPGVAISSIKIDGVLHEFSTIPGVTEDVSEIILNLKGVRFKTKVEKPDKVMLHLKGPGDFLAGEIGKDNTQFKVLNPGLFICKMNEKADFNIEIKLSRGVGWVPAEDNKTIDYPIGTIFVDSLYSPIKNVSFKVDNLPGTSREVLEKLALEIKTDGSIKPEKALDYSSKILKEYFGLFSSLESEPVVIPKGMRDEEVIKIRKLLQKNIDEMELSVRSHNCLKQAKIETIEDLVSKDEAWMLKQKNFGRKSLNELMAKLKGMGLEFGMNVNKYLVDRNE